MAQVPAAFEVPTLKLPGFSAGADLSALQFTLVKINSATNQIVASNAAGEAVVGILQNKPLLNQTAEVGLLGIFKVKCGAAVTTGALLTVNASGLAVAATTGNQVFGKALGTATGSGSIITCFLYQQGVSA